MYIYVAYTCDESDHGSKYPKLYREPLPHLRFLMVTWFAKNAHFYSAKFSQKIGTILLIFILLVTNLTLFEFYQLFLCVWQAAMIQRQLICALNVQFICWGIFFFEAIFVLYHAKSSIKWISFHYFEFLWSCQNSGKLQCTNLLHWFCHNDDATIYVFCCLPLIS